MGIPSCACVPPDGDIWTEIWPRECGYHREQREAIEAARLALLDRKSCGAPNSGLKLDDQRDRILLGDYFTHDRTGLRFSCKGIIRRDIGDFNQETTIEVVPNA